MAYHQYQSHLSGVGGIGFGDASATALTVAAAAAQLKTKFAAPARKPGTHAHDFAYESVRAIAIALGQQVTQKKLTAAEAKAVLEGAIRKAFTGVKNVNVNAAIKMGGRILARMIKLGVKAPLRGMWGLGGVPFAFDPAKVWSDWLAGASGNNAAGGRAAKAIQDALNQLGFGPLTLSVSFGKPSQAAAAKAAAAWGVTLQQYSAQYGWPNREFVYEIGDLSVGHGETVTTSDGQTVVVPKTKVPPGATPTTAKPGSTGPAAYQAPASPSETAAPTPDSGTFVPGAATTPASTLDGKAPNRTLWWALGIGAVAVIGLVFITAPPKKPGTKSLAGPKPLPALPPAHAKANRRLGSRRAVGRESGPVAARRRIGGRRVIVRKRPGVKTLPFSVFVSGEWVGDTRTKSDALRLAREAMA